LNGQLQPWARGGSNALAAIMVVAAILWNIDFFEWLGYAFVPEQYYAVIMAMALAVVFMTVRIDRSQDTARCRGTTPPSLCWPSWCCSMSAIISSN